MCSESQILIIGQRRTDEHTTAEYNGSMALPTGHNEDAQAARLQTPLHAPELLVLRSLTRAEAAVEIQPKQVIEYSVFAAPKTLRCIFWKC